MSGFLLGSNASMWVPLGVLVPLNDAHSETIGTVSQSISGVTTQNIRAIKRRWSLPQRVANDALMAQLTILREVFQGPFWLYDITRPNLLSTDRRMMTGWTNAGAVLTPSVDLRLTVPASGTIAPEALTGPSLPGLIPVNPGDTLTIGITAKAASVVGLVIGFRWYSAAGTFLSASLAPSTLGTTEARLSNTATAPTSAAYLQPSLSTSSGIVATVTDLTVVPGTVDIGAAWHVVLIDDFTEQHHNALQHSPTLVLREV